MRTYTVQIELRTDALGWVASIEEPACQVVGRTIASARFGIRKALGLALQLDGFAELARRAGAHVSAIPAVLASAGVEIAESIKLPPEVAAAVCAARTAGDAALEAERRADELKRAAALALDGASVGTRDVALLLDTSVAQVDDWTRASWLR